MGRLSKKIHCAFHLLSEIELPLKDLQISMQSTNLHLNHKGTMSGRSTWRESWLWVAYTRKTWMNLPHGTHPWCGIGFPPAPMS